MTDYYKYLPLSKEDENWGLSVLNIGCTHIAGENSYPLKAHPASHHFTWETGRILNEYQIIYITNGKGIFESDSCKRREILAGTIIVLFPGERHRYRPDHQTGWDEYWIGLKGDIIDNLARKHFIRKDNPSLYIGFHEAIFNLFNNIIDVAKRESYGYQPLISGAALHLMGIFHFAMKQQGLKSEEKELIVDKAKLLFRSNVTNDFSAKDAAQQLQVGYSWFRKEFKYYTGLSPGQYFIQLKIEFAKELLSDLDVPIKNIAIDLRFDNYFYFSKMFKEKTGMTPKNFRDRISNTV